MTGDGVSNPRIADDTESAEEMMKRFPPTPMEETDLFYMETDDTNHNYIRNNYRANTETTKSVRWKPVLKESNDGKRRFGSTTTK